MLGNIFWTIYYAQGDIKIGNYKNPISYIIHDFSGIASNKYTKNVQMLFEHITVSSDTGFFLDDFQNVTSYRSFSNSESFEPV